MQNDQCSICWDLKFDKQGDKTHEEFKDDFHDFVPLDHCVKCKEPKYDSNGFKTHPNETHDFIKTQNNVKSHKFTSGNLTKNQEKDKNVFLPTLELRLSQLELQAYQFYFSNFQSLFIILIMFFTRTSRISYFWRNT